MTGILMAYHCVANAIVKRVKGSSLGEMYTSIDRRSSIVEQ